MIQFCCFISTAPNTYPTYKPNQTRIHHLHIPRLRHIDTMYPKHTQALKSLMQRECPLCIALKTLFGIPEFWQVSSWEPSAGWVTAMEPLGSSTSIPARIKQGDEGEGRVEKKESEWVMPNPNAASVTNPLQSRKSEMHFCCITSAC